MLENSVNSFDPNNVNDLFSNSHTNKTKKNTKFRHLNVSPAIMKEKSVNMSPAMIKEKMNQGIKDKMNQSRN